MKQINSIMQDHSAIIKRIRPVWFLASGILLMGLSHLSYSVDLIAWIAMVPFLLYLSTTEGLKSRMLFVLALIAAWSVIIVKIITPPIPYLFIFMYSVPISIIHLSGYILFARFSEKRWVTLLFPAGMVVLEWLQYTFTPLGSWGAAAYTQNNTLSVMQSLSLFGTAGLGFMVYWINASIYYTIRHSKICFSTFYLPVASVLVLVIFGSMRLNYGHHQVENEVVVAAVGTDSEAGGLPLPTDERNEKDIATLFQRTKVAAASGAILIVWNEASFVLKPENESRWMDSIKRLAYDTRTTLIASYVKVIAIDPLKYENKYLFVDSTGTVKMVYHKHQPVPGEPAVKGKEDLQVIPVNRTFVGGAICYDYDFPYLARRFGKIGADIIALPSSDWKGIDPLHTRMAAFRAIENGQSILRSTRFGLSAAITPYGKTVGEMSSYNSRNRILISALPSKGVRTLYSRTGDVVVYLSIIYLFVFMFFLRDQPEKTSAMQ